MRTIEGTIKKAVLAFGGLTQHEGYIVESLCGCPAIEGHIDKHFWRPITDTNGEYPGEFETFVNKHCKLVVSLDGLVLRVKMIESSDGGTWSV